MAYVIFGDPVCKAPVEKFQETFNAQGPYDDYCMEQAKLIQEQDEFARANRLARYARPADGFRYPHIPTEPFPIYNKTVVESLPGIFIYYANTVFVNAKARAVLESVEPNVHQYVPVQFVNPKGGPELEPYWIVNVCTRLVATNLEFSNLKEKSRVDFTDFPDGRYTTFFGAKLPCVSGPTDTKMILKVNKDVLAGRAIWKEWKLKYCFLTDAFVRAPREAGIEPGYAHNDFHAEEI